jgi:hypothetical protein
MGKILSELERLIHRRVAEQQRNTQHRKPQQFLHLLITSA